MRPSGKTIELSASDLAQCLGCRHRTALDLAVALGLRAAPSWVDPVAVVLQQRGLEHEHRYADALRAQGLEVVDLSACGEAEAVAETLFALRTGTAVILHAALRSGRWFGRPDVLRRIESPSALGAWSYQVFDTKLARTTRAGTILQLALYSDLLGVVQGVPPELFHVVTPEPAAPLQTYRVGDFAAYFRLIRDRLDGLARQSPAAIAAAYYPEPVEHCDVCRWWSECDRHRRADDHLSLVAGSSRLQRRELRTVGITTLAELGTTPLPLPFEPARGAPETYVRIREQARLQLAGRTSGAPVYELLPLRFEHGLARLPMPSCGDVFLDLEGDPFAREGGREYLFGLVIAGPGGTITTRSFWAGSDAEERAGFEATVDEILRSWATHPGMHVYHYAPYEPSAFKRLMGRHATRESAIDRLLRAERFVDLYAIVRHAVRASVERYSIKDLEPFYGFTRSVSLLDARTNLRLFERALELGAADAISSDVRAAIEGYNRDDCLSALRLRAWLEGLRASIEADGTAVPRPMTKDGAASERVDDRARRVQSLVVALTSDVPSEATERNEQQQARWLLAQLLDWHRREGKAPWWEFFRLRGRSEHELRDEPAAVAGLTFLARIGGTKQSPIDRYRFPPQDVDVRADDSLYLPDGTDFGRVEALDRLGRTIDIKKRGAQAEVHPSALFAHSVVNTDVLAEALARLGEDVIQYGIAAGTNYRVARELLLGRSPRLCTGPFAPRAGETPVQFAIRVVSELDHSVLAIQGPPGAGKTYTGARMICERVRRGARIGITAVSHKVIRKLLDDVRVAARDLLVSLTCIHKVTAKGAASSTIEELTDNDEVVARLVNGQVQVVGATPWFWARPNARDVIDVLFVDEAGQMSLANVLAASQAAKSVVLLGDPQQLEQPQQGSHPEGADHSALEHLLGALQTIPAGRGIFLSETWRLAPSLCAFTSEAFYDGRLRPRAGLERQRLLGTPPFEGAGLWIASVAHEGNQNASLEEAAAVEQIVARLLAPGSGWVDCHGATRPMTADDILIVAPYNAHVALIEERLENRGIRVGTVDRFQGQEAAVVIYSMATSTPEDAPRGMEFLYSLNRLNVATSRARCVCILVASPRLFEPECRSPRQMRFANALCRYAELARFIEYRDSDPVP